MKSSFLTKTLLCGVMATTFLLINCQKAPSRGVKAKTGTVEGVDSKTAADKAEVLVQCSDSFVSAYTEAHDLLKKLESEKIEGLSEAEQATLNQKLEDAKVKVEAAVTEITKVKSDATGCTVPGKDGKAATKYSILNIRVSLAKLISKAKTGGVQLSEDLVATATNVQNQIKQLNERMKVQKDIGSLVQGMKFVISDDLAKTFNEQNVGAVYYKAGDIIKSFSDESKAKDLADKTLSMCELVSGTGDIEKGEQANVLTIDAPSIKDATSGRYKLNVVLTVKSVNVNLNCVLAEAKRESFGAEFRNVFGEHLLTEANIAANKKKKEVSIQKLKETAAKKEQGLKDATTAVAKKQTELSEKKAKFTEAADDATLKESLTAEIEALEKKITELEKAQKTAETQKQEADEALRLAEAAAAEPA